MRKAVEKTFVKKTDRDSKLKLLLSRVAAGNKTAIRDCIDIFGDLIWSLAKKNTGSTEDAEVLTQKIFSDIWMFAKCYDPNKTTEWNFIETIVSFRLIKHKKRE